MITARDVTALRSPHNGSWEVSALVNGHLVTRTYYGFTKREAVSDFLREVRQGPHFQRGTIFGRYC